MMTAEGIKRSRIDGAYVKLFEMIYKSRLNNDGHDHVRNFVEAIVMSSNTHITERRISSGAARNNPDPCGWVVGRARLMHVELLPRRDFDR